jgi:murein DD-endopeptidase MepM/ murein hydrolase activator NlpD
VNDLVVYILLWMAMSGGRRRRTRTGLDAARLVWPVVLDDGGPSRITQEFRAPDHLGVDIAVPGHYKDAAGDIVAVADGRVARAVRGKRGWYVLVDHGDWGSSYLHMTSIGVSTGQQIAAGGRIGRMGADPLDRNAVVHLHFQLLPAGETVDPQPYLQRGGV